jgi:hypothetical protein
MARRQISVPLMFSFLATLDERILLCDCRGVKLGKLENLPTFVGVCSFCKKGQGALNYYFYKCLQSVWIRFATDSLKGTLSWQTHVKIEQFHLDK